MLFSQNISTDIALGVDIRTFRVRWRRKIARHTASPGRVCNSSMNARHGQLSASNRAQQPRRPMGCPGLFLAPGGIHPLAPGFARGTPFLGFSSGPPGVGSPGPFSPGGARYGGKHVFVWGGGRRPPSGTFPRANTRLGHLDASRA